MLNPRWRLAFLVVATTAFLSQWSSTLAAEPVWKVGLAQVKITPEQPLPLAGYGGREIPFESVADDLYAKVLLLEDQAGQRGAIITSDLIGFRADQAEELCRQIAQQTGLRREQILVNSSHTHAGPHLTLDPEDRAYGMTAETVAGTLSYTRQMISKVAGAVAQATTKLEPAELSWGTGFCPFVMNRREFTPGGIKLGNNFRGLADRSVPVLRIDQQGKPRAVMFGAAVHNTTLTGQNLVVSGDYAGYAQQHVEQQGLKAMFLLGCAGAANPYPRGTLELARVHGRTLGSEVVRVTQEKLAPVRGPLRLAFDHVDLPLRTSYSPDQLAAMLKGTQSWEAPLARRIQQAMAKGETIPQSYRAPVAVWQFGDDLTLVALSGEVVVDYVTLIERALGPLNLWVAAYSNDVFGYLPSAQVLAEGGYETRGIIHGSFGLFAPEAEQVLVKKVQELAQRVGRTMQRESGK